MKISDIIKRKLDGDELSDKEIMILHKHMLRTSSEYREKIDKEMKKQLKKLVPKGTLIK